MEGYPFKGGSVILIVAVVPLTVTELTVGDPNGTFALILPELMLIPGPNDIAIQIPRVYYMVYLLSLNRGVLGVDSK
jgi:hypothetical protein